MRAAMSLILLLFAAANAGAAPQPWTHVRPTSAGARELLLFATQRSSIVRAMLDQIEQTDVIVQLSFSNEPGEEHSADFMTFVADAGGSRFVAVCIRWRWTPMVARIPRLAHELQHVLELAQATDVRDRDSFARLFRTIGWQSGGDGRYETDRARQTESLVGQEVSGGRFEARASNNALSKSYRSPM